MAGEVVAAKEGSAVVVLTSGERLQVGWGRLTNQDYLVLRRGIGVGHAGCCAGWNL